MLTIHGNGIFKKTAEILNKDLLPKRESHTGWDKLKDDLEGLSKSQLDLILRLVAQMKKVNKADHDEIESNSK